jgi:hypothetical protein
MALRRLTMLTAPPYRAVAKEKRAKEKRAPAPAARVGTRRDEGTSTTSMAHAAAIANRNSVERRESPGPMPQEERLEDPEPVARALRERFRRAGRQSRQNVAMRFVKTL